uniref:Uncharacterized protein n=1 Tax=Panagrolaimus sp. ES5 TaxID=591445 RepID=A0AC34F619_9BILA
MKKEVIASNDETPKKGTISPPRSMPPPSTTQLTSSTSLTATKELSTTPLKSLASTTQQPLPSAAATSLVSSTPSSTTTSPISPTNNDNVVKLQSNDSRKKIEPYISLVAMAEDLEAEDEKIASESKGGSGEKQKGGGSGEKQKGGSCEKQTQQHQQQLPEIKAGTEKKSNQNDTKK